MSSSTPEPLGNGFSAAVVTVSDSCSRGERNDLSGTAIAKTLTNFGFQVTAQEIIPDELSAIETQLIHFCQSARLVVTTGGTGISARDVTPEATIAVCDRLLPGIAEHMRSAGMQKTRFAALSRAVCGVRGTNLILNLPGNPSGAVESLASVIDLLPHALDLLAGKTEHEKEPAKVSDCKV
jgi:molybdopterin adenylyltransferase